MAVAVRVEILLFARLRELAGCHRAALELTGGVTVQDVWSALIGVHPRLGGAERSLRAAVNETYVPWNTAVSDGDVVAFIPPVAGGSGPAIHVAVTQAPLDARRIEELIRGDGDGALCTFTGVVRDNADGHTVTRLDYEAYTSMAEAEMRTIGTEAARRFGVSAVAAIHRVGSLAVGEAAVVVSVSAPHRAAAFEACRYVIDTLKEQAPIWKREHGPDGALWVEARPAG